MNIYIIPGAFEGPKTKRYKPLIKALKKYANKVKILEVPWKYKTVSQCAEWVEQEIKSDVRNSIILGFSWSAMILFKLLGQNVCPKHSLLTSLSPYFKEDMPTTKKEFPILYRKYKRRITDFESDNWNYKKQSQLVTCPFFVFAGEKETKSIQKTFKRVSKHKMCKKSVLVKGAHHDIGEENYIKEIVSVIKQIT